MLYPANFLYLMQFPGDHLVQYFATWVEGSMDEREWRGQSASGLLLTQPDDIPRNLLEPHTTISQILVSRPFAFDATLGATTLSVTERKEIEMLGCGQRSIGCYADASALLPLCLSSVYQSLRSIFLDYSVD
jgi:hypothetical protein